MHYLHIHLQEALVPNHLMFGCSHPYLRVSYGPLKVVLHRPSCAQENLNRLFVHERPCGAAQTLKKVTPGCPQMPAKSVCWRRIPVWALCLACAWQCEAHVCQQSHASSTGAGN